MLLAKTMPNRTTISVTEMVVCNRDRWETEVKETKITSLQSLLQRWWSVTEIGG